MKLKSLITGLLALFVIISAVYLVTDSYNKIQSAPGDVKSQLSQRSFKEEFGRDLEHNIIVHYFYTNYRCKSCITIESLTQKVLQKSFSNDLLTGKLIWKAINIDKDKNKHFIEDYDLATKSVVVLEVKDNKQLRWKNLSKIWELLNDEKAFINYIEQETKQYLGDI